MKFKLSALTAALFAAVITMTACGKGSSDSSSDMSYDAPFSNADRFNEDDDHHLFGDSDADSGSESSSEDDGTVIIEVTQPPTEEHVEQSMVADENAVPASGAKPVLAVSNTSGAPGETVEVTVSISGADQKWSMCGVHVTFDERLTCVPSAEDPKTPDFEKEDAIKDFGGFVTALQVGEDRNEYLISNKMSAVFFAAVDSADVGRDGDIVTYKFTIPEDAQSGTVYDFGFYYREGDMFLDKAHDEALQDYVFSHWQKGTITVE